MTPLPCQPRIPESKLIIPTNSFIGDLAFARTKSLRYVEHGNKSRIKVEVKEEELFNQMANLLSCRSPFIRTTLENVHTMREFSSFDPGFRLRVIGLAGWSTGYHQIAVLNRNTTATELNGKRLILNYDATLLAMLLEGLTQVDLKLTDLKTLVIREKFVARDFMLERMDGLGLVQSDYQLITQEFHLRPLFSSRYSPRLHPEVLAVREDYYRANKIVINALLRAWSHARNRLAWEQKRYLDGGDSTEQKTWIHRATRSSFLDASDDSDLLVKVRNQTIATSDQETQFFANQPNWSNFANLNHHIEKRWKQVQDLSIYPKLLGSERRLTEDIPLPTEDLTRLEDYQSFYTNVAKYLFSKGERLPLFRLTASYGQERNLIEKSSQILAIYPELAVYIRTNSGWTVPPRVLTMPAKAAKKEIVHRRNTTLKISSMTRNKILALLEKQQIKIDPDRIFIFGDQTYRYNLDDCLPDCILSGPSLDKPVIEVNFFE